MVRYIVLGLLRRGTAHHGYALLKEYRRRSGSHLIGGRLYGEIQRLVREGLVRPTSNSSKSYEMHTRSRPVCRLCRPLRRALPAGAKELTSPSFVPARKAVITQGAVRRVRDDVA